VVKFEMKFSATPNRNY